MVRHRTLRTLLAAALLVVSAVACGDDDDSAGSTTTTTVGETTTDATTTTEPTTTTEAASTSVPYELTVEDPGQEPRRPLRLAVGAGDTDEVTLRQETTIEAAAGGQVQSVPSPINEFDVTYTVEDVTEDRISTSGTYDDVRVLDTPGVDPGVIAELRSMMEGFRDARARTTFTTQGGLLHADLEGLDVPGAAGPMAEQMAATFTDSAQSLSLPFPEEPIGPGGRWRVDTAIELAGLPVEITTTVELVELDEGRAAGTVDQTLRFVPGDVEIMGLAATVISGELAGGGPIEWDLAGGVVPRSDITISGTAVMEANGVRIEQRQQQRMTYAAR